MTAFLTDEDFREPIVRGLRRQSPSIDVLSVRDLGLVGSADPVVLDVAAEQGRVVWSHDVTTMRAAAEGRLRRGEPMPGLVLVPWRMPTGLAISELLVMVKAAGPADFDGQVLFVPI